MILPYGKIFTRLCSANKEHGRAGAERERKHPGKERRELLKHAANVIVEDQNTWSAEGLKIKTLLQEERAGRFYRYAEWTFFLLGQASGSNWSES